MARTIDEALVAQLEGIVSTEGVRRDEPMAAHTTFHIGGPADLFVCPATEDELVEAIRAVREAGVPHFLLGLGSDLLVGDGGYRGVMVCCAEALDELSVDMFGTMTAQAGVALKDASAMATELSLTGLEFACGIPGSIGGAVFMNAGAYDGCMADVLDTVRVLTPEGEVVEMAATDLALGYRSSRVQSEGLVVLSATMRLEPGNQSEIRAKVADLTARREEKQPLELGSAGSTFKRPEGYFAGKLITDAGLKGYQVGAAAVSTKHAGFVVNLGDATAADVRAVIAHVQDEVERQFGVRLEPEVRFVGEF